MQELTMVDGNVITSAATNIHHFSAYISDIPDLSPDQEWYRQVHSIKNIRQPSFPWTDHWSHSEAFHKSGLMWMQWIRFRYCPGKLEASEIMQSVLRQINADCKCNDADFICWYSICWCFFHDLLLLTYNTFSKISRLSGSTSSTLESIISKKRYVSTCVSTFAFGSFR